MQLIYVGQYTKWYMYDICKFDE